MPVLDTLHPTTEVDAKLIAWYAQKVLTPTSTIFGLVTAGGFISDDDVCTQADILAISILLAFFSGLLLIGNTHELTKDQNETRFRAYALRVFNYPFGLEKDPNTAYAAFRRRIRAGNFPKVSVDLRKTVIKKIYKEGDPLRTKKYRQLARHLTENADKLSDEQRSRIIERLDKSDKFRDQLLQAILPNDKFEWLNSEVGRDDLSGPNARANRYDHRCAYYHALVNVNYEHKGDSDPDLDDYCATSEVDYYLKLSQETVALYAFAISYSLIFLGIVTYMLSRLGTTLGLNYCINNNSTGTATSGSTTAAPLETTLSPTDILDEVSLIVGLAVAFSTAISQATIDIIEKRISDEETTLKEQNTYLLQSGPESTQAKFDAFMRQLFIKHFMVDAEGNVQARDQGEAYDIETGGNPRSEEDHDTDNNQTNVDAIWVYRFVMARMQGPKAQANTIDAYKNRKKSIKESLEKLLSSLQKDKHGQRPNASGAEVVPTRNR